VSSSQSPRTQTGSKLLLLLVVVVLLQPSFHQRIESALHNVPLRWPCTVVLKAAGTALALEEKTADAKVKIARRAE
jgi:hypothetical protein